MKNLEAENESLRQENTELRRTLAEALARIKALEAQLSQNSRNSHWPSSRDKGKPPRRTKSLRQQSDKSAGGQAGHAGQTMEFSAVPDRVERHRPDRCVFCQTPLNAPAQSIQRRQVVDIPPMQMAVTEHQVETVVCACCGRATTGTFPAEVTNPVQYGPHVKALAVYLQHVQFIPFERTRMLLSDLFGTSLSPGTLQNFVHAAATRIRPVAEQIKQALQQEAVLNCDESGFYIGGHRHWLHTTGSSRLTYYAPHPARGRKATDAIGILPGFQGTAVHDHYSSYWTYTHCDHALCNVHLLRDLNGLEEQGDQPWTSRFKRLLLAAKAVVDASRCRGEARLPPWKLRQVERLYDRLTSQALAANPPPAGGWPRGKRGRPKKTKARNLAERFQNYRPAILAFVYDFKVPFDNNLAERDIRMLKVQQKISGCFRSADGAKDFCTLRSYVSTLRKQGLDIWSALNSAFSDQLIEPTYTPV